MSGRKPKDITGQRFGRLVALKQKGRALNGCVLWECKCDCGSVVVVRGYRLRAADADRNRTRSCGCLTEEVRGDTTRKPEGASSAHAVWYSYKRRAELKGIEFTLTEGEFLSLVTKVCFYCGDMPANESWKPSANGSFVYNGLDRIDNTKGYTWTNVVPCCADCNQAKCKLTQNEFISLCKRVARRFSGNV